MTTITEGMVEAFCTKFYRAWLECNDGLKSRMRPMVREALTAALSTLPPAPDFSFTHDSLNRYLDKVREAWEAARSSPPDRETLDKTPGGPDEHADQWPTWQMRMAGINASPSFPMPELVRKSGTTSLSTDQVAEIYLAMQAAAPSPPDRDAFVKQAREFAVMYLAFVGRDRGTDRIDATLDQLKDMAVKLDAASRAIFDASQPDRNAVIETMRTALEDAEQTIDLHVNGASSIDIFLRTLEHIQSALKTDNVKP